MLRNNFSMFNDSFFTTPSNFESSFANLESFMNQPFGNSKMLSIGGPESKSRDISLTNHSFDDFFSDFDSHLKGINDMFNKRLEKFDINFNPNDPNVGSFYSASSVYSYCNDSKDGKEPRIYQAHKSVRGGPGGLREEQKAEKDSYRAEEKMAIGRYIGDRGREIERKRNTKTGTKEENIQYRGIDESDSNQFNDEWEQLANRCFNFGPKNHSHRITNYDHRPSNDNRGNSNRQLAITDGKSRSRKQK